LIIFYDFIVSIIVSIIVITSIIITFFLFSKLTNLIYLQRHEIEFIWTLIPVFILLSIAWPSLQILYLLDDPFNPSVSLKAIGHQWYWSYELPDVEGVRFDAYIDLNSSFRPRLLDVTNRIVLPVNNKVRVLTSRTDVIHAWTIPALGVKADALPGRINQIIIIADRVGVYFGQCSELCGANHRFIPIKLEIVPINTFLNFISSYVYELDFS